MFLTQRFFYTQKITMPKISDNDLAEIFADSDVSDTATIAGASVNGYFFAPYQNDLGIAGNKPTFRCAPASVVGVVTGDALVYSGTNYVITSRQDDRAGAVLFELRAQ